MNRSIASMMFTSMALAASLLMTTQALAQGRDGQTDLTIDAAARTEVIEGVIKRLNDFYVFPEVAKQMEAAIRQRMQNKEYDRITSAALLAQTLTSHLRAISHDKHLEVHSSYQPLPLDDSRSEPTPEQRERMRRFAASINYGFEKIDRLEGNIGYLRVDGFMPADVGAETAIAAMSFLANTDALIFDLRYSVNGGDPTMSTLLSSYLFDSEPVHLGDIYWREGNRTRQIWTMPYVPGKKYIGKDVYFLVSKDTISAGEGFAYDLQNLKRVTVIGGITAGAANPGFEYRISEHFFMFVPMGRAINPITKTNWEGTGVKPDIEVPAEQALRTAHLMALKKLLASATDERTKGRLRGVIETLEREKKK
ncbi:MAG: S41 family peptidase [Acidobacteria bacterium]|nr:S41 family peptidase [Acidobacteriota bacterium]